MKSLFTKLGFPQAAGLYNDGQTVFACQIAFSPIGERVVQRISEPIEQGRCGEALDRLLDKLANGHEISFAVGVPTADCYFATRPVAAGGGQASPKVLLRESLRSAAGATDGMVADVVNARPDKREVASIAACRRELLDTFREPLEQRGHRLVTAKPAPVVLLRLAGKQNDRLRKSKAVVRIFLSETHVLAVFTANGHPIAWREFTLPRGDEAAAILAASRSLSTVAQRSGVEREPEAVVVHGRYDLNRLVDVEWIRQELRVPFQWLESPEYCGEQIALDLAQAALKQSDQQFDLARDARRRKSLLQMMPWRELALYAAILLVMLGLLWNRNHEVTTEYQTTVAVMGDAANQPLSDLQNEKKQLEAQVNAASRFVRTRVLWTPYLRDLAKNLPDQIRLTSLQGVAQFSKPSRKSKGPAKKSLVIKGSISLAENGSMPHEIDRFLDSIREHPTISKDFPTIELADLKQFEEDEQTLAMFTVICMPKSK